MAAIAANTVVVPLANEDDAAVEETKAIFRAGGVAHIRDLHVWRVSPHQRFLMATVEGESIAKDSLLENLRSTDRYAHITIEHLAKPLASPAFGGRPEGFCK